jgi:hypothetical protein
MFEEIFVFYEYNSNLNIYEHKKIKLQLLRD